MYEVGSSAHINHSFFISCVHNNIDICSQVIFSMFTLIIMTFIYFINLECFNIILQLNQLLVGRICSRMNRVRCNKSTMKASLS